MANSFRMLILKIEKPISGEIRQHNQELKGLMTNDIF